MFGKSLREEFGATLKDVIRLYDWRDQAVIFAGLARVFTEAQGARFVWGGDLTEARRGLDHLTTIDGRLGRIDNVPLPSGLVDPQTTVYYATPAAGNWLVNNCPELAKRTRFGRPNGKLEARIAHELIITEALVRIWLDFEVEDFLPDEELRRRILRERARRKRLNEPRLASEVTGDFVVVVPADSPRGRERWSQYEAAVRYSARQIAEKPPAMTWFTCSSTQADIIERVTGRRPLMINSVTSVDPERTIPRPDDGRVGDTQQSFQTKGMSERRALLALQRLAGGATAEAIAAVTSTDPGNVCRTLNALGGRGLVIKHYGSFDPGIRKGRSMAIFVLPDVPIDSYHDKLVILARSQVIVTLFVSHYSLSALDRSNGELVFRHADPSKRAVVALIDDARLALAEATRALAVLRVRWPRERAHLYYIVTEPSRGSGVKAVVPDVNVVDILASRVKQRKVDPGRNDLVNAQPHARSRRNAELTVSDAAGQAVR